MIVETSQSHTRQLRVIVHVTSSFPEFPLRARVERRTLGGQNTGHAVRNGLKTIRTDAKYLLIDLFSLPRFFPPIFGLKMFSGSKITPGPECMNPSGRSLDCAHATSGNRLFILTYYSYTQTAARLRSTLHAYRVYVSVTTPVVFIVILFSCLPYKTYKHTHTHACTRTRTHAHTLIDKYAYVCNVNVRPKYTPCVCSRRFWKTRRTTA